MVTNPRGIDVKKTARLSLLIKQAKTFGNTFYYMDARDLLVTKTLVESIRPLHPGSECRIFFGVTRVVVVVVVKAAVAVAVAVTVAVAVVVVDTETISLSFTS